MLATLSWLLLLLTGLLVLVALLAALVWIAHGLPRDARVSKREVLVRRGEQWFRYGAPKRQQ